MTGPLPVTVVGGFLGAGKTSLLNHLLATLRGRRVAVLVNDFGALDIDAQHVERVEGDVISLKGGCMCCAIRDSAVSSVLALAERAEAPEHVVIEASGVSDVAALRDTFRGLERHQTVRLDGLVTVVDLERFLPRDPELGLLLRCQVMAADLVVLNKADLVDAARLEAVRAEVEALTPGARVAVTTQGRLPPELLVGGAPEDLARAPRRPERGSNPVAPHGAADLFETSTFTLPAPAPGRALVQALAALPAEVYRSKGFVRLLERPEDRVLVQTVGRRVHVQTVGTWTSPDAEGALVVIARRGVRWAEVAAALDAVTARRTT